MIPLSVVLTHYYAHYSVRYADKSPLAEIGNADFRPHAEGVLINKQIVNALALTVIKSHWLLITSVL